MAATAGKETAKAASKGAKERPKARPGAKAHAGAGGGVSIRMYRHGLGDCFLLRFAKDGAAGTFNVLIDCGLITVAQDVKEKMQKVTADIDKACAGRVDLAIMTHEHWDHASGFSTQQAQDRFDKIAFGEVWYAWTEDPTNTLGRRLRRERESKLRALQFAALAMSSNRALASNKRAKQFGTLLRFFGFDGPQSIELQALGARGDSAIGKTRAAFEYLGRRREVKTSYCRPGQDPILLSALPGVRIYVLGPPEDESMIRRSSPTKTGKEVYEFSAERVFEDNLAAAFQRLADPGLDSDGKDCPFEAALARRPEATTVVTSSKLGALVAQTWDDPDEQWRRIEEDWTAAAETLALNLDSNTNNTCLVIAFEFVKSGKVLLFPGDAQVGNWLSWQDVRFNVKDPGGKREVTGADLLKRTVFYKVGHHGSHNGTLRGLGLEEMASDELVAFVPVFKEEAKKSGWNAMPFGPLTKRLEEKTVGRLIYSDNQVELPTDAVLKRLSDSERAGFRASLETDPDGLYYEYRVSP